MGASTVSPERDMRSSVAALGDWPGLRTLRSARFRLLLALTIWTLGAVLLAVVLLGQATDPAGQYAFDFQVYHAAAADVAAGRSPYAASMFEGPVPAQGELLYKYPPILAQLLTPLAGVSLPSAAAVWLCVQAALTVAGVWLAARAGGAPRGLETVAWSGAAATLFLPIFDTLWKGNVSGVLVFLAALALAGGVWGGLGAAASTLLKTTPVMMMPAALVAGRRQVTGVLLAAAVTLVSIALAPQAWMDFVRLLPNLVAGPTAFNTNLAPDAQIAQHLPGMPLAAQATRLAVMGLGIGAVAASAIAARRQEAWWPAAVALGVSASLLLPSATWYHYLAVLLPLGAYAWPRAASPGRLGLFLGAAAITVGVAWLPLAVAGAILLGAAAIATLWPARLRVGEPGNPASSQPVEAAEA